MVGALLSVPAAEFGKYGDKLLMIQSEFGEMDFVTGYFLLIPELDSYDKIFGITWYVRLKIFFSLREKFVPQAVFLETVKIRKRMDSCIWGI